jgi:hypothetical protein
VAHSMFEEVDSCFWERPALGVPGAGFLLDENKNACSKPGQAVGILVCGLACHIALGRKVGAVAQRVVMVLVTIHSKMRKSWAEIIVGNQAKPKGRRKKIERRADYVATAVTTIWRGVPAGFKR